MCRCFLFQRFAAQLFGRSILLAITVRPGLNILYKSASTVERKFYFKYNCSYYLLLHILFPIRLFLQCFFCVYLSLKLEGIRVVFLISSFKFKVQEKWLKLTGDGTQVNMTLVMELINKINLPQSGPALQGCTVNVP